MTLTLPEATSPEILPGSPHVLIITGPEPVSRVLLTGIEGCAFSADLVACDEEALTRARDGSYSVIVFDLTNPDPDGLELCRHLRTVGVGTPIIFLAAGGSVDDRVRGLEAGADDFLVSPIVLRELLARIRAIGRRGPISWPPMFRCGDLSLDLVRHCAMRGEVSIPLSQKEFEVLATLMHDPGRAMSRSDILRRSWGGRLSEYSNMVDVYIGYLRQKIDRPFGRQSLQTVRGVGYRITADA